MFVSKPREVTLDADIVGKQPGGAAHVATIAPLGYLPLERVLLASLAADGLRRRVMVEPGDPNEPWESSREAFRRQRDRYDKPAFLTVAIKSWTFDRQPTAQAFNDIEDAAVIEYLFDQAWDISFPPEGEGKDDSPL